MAILRPLTSLATPSRDSIICRPVLDSTVAPRAMAILATIRLGS